MHGQGNYGHRTGQGPYAQHHLLPPPTSSQPLAASNSGMHRPPAAVPSQINQLLPMYDQVPRGPPFQGPPTGMPNTTNPSHASLPQPTPVLGRMPITGPSRNSQHNLHYPLHVGNQNSHHFPTPSPPPPPLVQGHTTYWRPVNSQPKQPISVQGPPIPNTPPPPPPPPPPQPPLPHASSSHVPPSPPFCRPLLPASSVSNISSSELALDVSGQRNDKVVTSEGRAVESLGKGYGSISALDRSTALEIDIHPAPPKPADEKIMKRIETLCQFVAKNGPGFEDMARTRESANPEFKFLFGGEPGSDAAVAHEYYQWAKKKYSLGDKLQEGALRPSEAGVSVQTKPFIMTSVAHQNSDSDMEMEDDITQVDMEQGMERPVEYHHENSDLVRDDHDGREPPMPQIVQSASAQDISCSKVPFSEVPGRSDYGHHGSGILPNHERLLPGIPSNRICSDSNLPEPAGASIAKKSTTVPADVSSPPISSPTVTSGRPFRLVHEYASDDSSENCAVPHSKEKHTMAELSVSPGHINKSDYTECRSESDLQVANPGKIEQVVRPLSESGKSFVAPTRVSNVKTRIVETVATSSEIGLSDEPSDTNYNGQGTIRNAVSSEACARNNSLGSLSTGSHENHTSEKETRGEKLRPNSTAVQVDEFGRLVRKGASDSDSDDSLYSGRRHKKRERSRSRSQSPVGRRSRLRRSLQRTRERRNRSRSWSPRGRRSRSRSPVLRHAKEFGNDGMRRNKSRKPECFDFVRGRCYRGASCRYSHHEAEMEQSKRQRRRAQTPEMHLRSNKTDLVEEMENLSARVPYSGDSEVKNKPWEIHKNVPDGISDAVKHEKRDDSLGHASRAYAFGRDGIAGEDEPKNDKKVVDMHLPYRQLVPEDDSSTRIPCTKKFEEGVGTHQPISVDRSIEQPLGGADSLKSCTDNAFKSASKNLLAVSSQSSPSRVGPQNANNLPWLDDSSQPLPDKIAAVISASESLPDIPHHPPQLPQHLSPFMQGAVTGNLQQVSGDHVVQQSPYASQGLPPSMLSGNQQPLVSAPQNSNWSSMLLPQPFPHVQYDSAVKGGAVAPALYTEFQQSHVSHTNFSSQMLKPYPTGVPAHSHVGEFPPGAYSAEPVSGQSLKPREDYRSSTYPSGNIPGPQVAGPGSAGPAHPNEPQRYPSGSMAPPEVLKFSSQVHPYVQQQYPPPALRHSGSAFTSPGGLSSSTFLPDGLGGKQTTALDYGRLRRSSHNPYASTFEQPLISKFSSGAFGQGFHSRYNTVFPFSHASVDGIGIGSVGSRQTISSPKSATLMDRNLPRVGGDQYDPLFDSIEPSSSSVKKVDRAHKAESVDSDVILRTSDSNTPLDVEENNKRKEIGAFAPSISIDDDGFGETAEVEVGAVENASISNPIDAVDATELEMEIDQIKSPGKSKKHKDSRSMKLFKISLADFVKEVLRPSWRQGNMSKEAFKTIVKKTVDKVTGAMKSHHIPKSQAKINHYIDSSQRKLTKLVMGYVDKYVNV